MTDSPVDFPELIIGIAGPIGINIEEITKKIGVVLKDLKYGTETIHLTKEITKFGDDDWLIHENDKFKNYTSKMDYANKLREKFQDPSTLARIAVQAVRELRTEHTSDVKKPRGSTAYVVRQLKLPEEVHLLRKVYGKQFILVSAYGTKNERRERLFELIKRQSSTDTPEPTIRHEVEQLIDRDEHEDSTLGQNLSDTFHLADVFIDGMSPPKMGSTIKRFFEAFFGKNNITPTKDEFGMYSAKSASLRSADLSRQVGACVISKDGDVLTESCNEVAKYGGGNYWDGESPDFRDIIKGRDPNDDLKLEVLKNIVERLSNADYLSDVCKAFGSADEIVKKLTNKKDSSGVLSDSKIMDLTEFGRVVHAEMNSICNAARKGISLVSANLYCTTFPCHNCTKHIIAAGISRVTYMEPYPKSRALELFSDEIEIETNSDRRKVSFIPFMGISPFRYRDIFEKGKRKSDGAARTWVDGGPRPLIKIDFPTAPTTTEPWALSSLIGKISQKS